MPVEQEPVDYDPYQMLFFLFFLLMLLLYLAKGLLPPFRDVTVNRYVFLFVEVIMGIVLGRYFARFLDLGIPISQHIA